MSDAEGWLVVIDPQAIFADPATSPWGTPLFTAAVPRIRELAAAYGDRVVVTRFVASSAPHGSWVPYYEEFPFALVPDTDPLYAVVPELADVAASAAADGRVVTEPTFGKWGAGLRSVVGDLPSLTLAGVATDCCVLSTALAAADAGASVQVSASACAGSSVENHDRALAAMALYAPQIEVVP